MKRVFPVLLLVCLWVAPAMAQRTEAERQPDSPIPRSKLLKHQHEEVRKMAARLVELSGEVEDDLQKQGENVLPLNTLKKLDEIEKLARKIRDRIKQ